MRLKPFLMLCGLLMLAPWAMAEEDFPTLARVEYVIGCMHDHGGENYDTMYACVCAVDYLRSQFSYDEYSQALTFRMLRGTPGETGGVFRDPAKSGVLRDKLDAADEAIANRCFLKTAKKPE